MKARLLFLSLLCAVAAPRVSLASGYICSDESVAYTLPLPNEPAPLNARPVVRLPLRGAEPECVYAACGEDVERIVLIEAPRARRVAAPTEEPTTVTSATSGLTKTFYVAPTGVLSRDTRYELRAFVRGLGSRSVLLGTFRTGSVRDDSPPIAGVFDTPVVHPVPPPSPPVPRGVSVLELGAPQLETFVTLSGTRATDDRTGDAALMYAIWSAPVGVAIDYASPPRGLFRPEPLYTIKGSPAVFNLGAANVCLVSSFDLPETGRLTLGVRPVDLAGYVGAVSELTIEIPSVSKKRKR